MEEQRINIVYVSDSNYAKLLTVSLTSLFINNPKRCNVYVLDDGIEEADKSKMDEIGKKYDCRIKFIVPQLGFLDDIKLEKWPRNIFYRLFLNQILGEQKVEKVIYLDCDTIVCGSLSELWSIDLKNKACAAVMECMDDFHKRKAGLSAKMPYYNSGVILIDLIKWKHDGIEMRIKDAILSNPLDKTEYPDEEVLNHVLVKNIERLHPKYNLTTIKCVYSYDELKQYRKSKTMYTANEYCEANTKPYIIHYTNHFLVDRPWVNSGGKRHPMARQFDEYYGKTYQSVLIPTLKSIGRLTVIMRHIISINRPLGIFFAGVMYAYLKPLKYKGLRKN